MASVSQKLIDASNREQVDKGMSSPLQSKVLCLMLVYYPSHQHSFTMCFFKPISADPPGSYVLDVQLSMKMC